MPYEDPVDVIARQPASAAELNQVFRDNLIQLDEDISRNETEITRLQASLATAQGGRPPWASSVPTIADSGKVVTTNALGQWEAASVKQTLILQPRASNRSTTTNDLWPSSSRDQTRNSMSMGAFSTGTGESSDMVWIAPRPAGLIANAQVRMHAIYGNYSDDRYDFSSDIPRAELRWGWLDEDDNITWVGDIYDARPTSVYRTAIDYDSGLIALPLTGPIGITMRGFAGSYHLIFGVALEYEVTI